MEKQNQEQKPQYAVVNSFFKRNKDDDLKTAVGFFNGDLFMEKKTGQYGDFIACELYVTLRDGDVEYYFGKDLVAADHKVKFEFLLGKHLYERMTKYTPRWGQTVAFCLYDMEITSWTKRDGQKGHSIKAKAANYNVIGGTKKADGSERPVMKIRGLDDTSAGSKAGDHAKAGYNGPTSVPGVKTGGPFTQLDDDDDMGELPF